MQTLEVTDEQYAFIQHLRAAIAENVVGKYGFVRERDAVQFLIDNVDREFKVEVEATVESTATADVADAVSAAVGGDGDGDGDSAGADRDGDQNFERTQLEAVSYDETGAAEANDEPDAGSAEPASTGGVDGSLDINVDADSDSDSEADGDATADEPESNAEASGNADDDEMLDEMMSLLETHDDKWTESSSSDYRYAVALPDGSTTDVQTKDDVRALLFKNYR